MRLQTFRVLVFVLTVSAAFYAPGSARAQLVGEGRSTPSSPFATCQRLLHERLQEVDGGPALSDPAFDVYVNPQLLGRAYASNDAALWTDVALQLVEGERVLLRSRQGISAAQALNLAVKAAADRQDRSSLERLAKHAARTQDQALTAQVAAAQKLAAVSRDATDRLLVPIEEVEGEEYLRIRYCVQKIDQAKLAGDVRTLAALEQDIPDCIPGPFQSHLRKMIGEARSALPEGGQPNEALLLFLTRLEAASRPDAELFRPEPKPYNDSEAYQPQNVSGQY